MIPTHGALDKLPQLVLVTVSTAEGIDGHYVSYLIPARRSSTPPGSQKTVLVGRDTYDVAALNHEMTTALPPYSNPPALAGADACLWDINAKAAGLPLYKYLGAPPRDPGLRKHRRLPHHRRLPRRDPRLPSPRDSPRPNSTPSAMPGETSSSRRAIRHEFPHLDLMIDPVCA